MRHLAEIFRFSGDRQERTWQARHQVLHLPSKGGGNVRVPEMQVLVSGCKCSWCKLM